MEIQTDDPLAAGDAAGKLNRSRSQRCDFNDAIRLAQLFFWAIRENESISAFLFLVFCICILRIHIFICNFHTPIILILVGDADVCVLETVVADTFGN